MKVILLENNSKLGTIGNIIKINNGYANNYLFPNGKAIILNKTNLIKIKDKKSNLENIFTNKAKLDIKKLNEINNMSIITSIITKEDNETIYGSINNSNIIKLINNLGFNINKKNIKQKNIIKKTGTYEIELIFNKNKIKLYLTVIRKKINDKL